jgi:GR25 family glycosyltransferase involved in LPS biosynthesis
MNSYIIILKDNLKSEKFGKLAIESAKQLQWNVERFDGIDGRTINNETFKSMNLFINQENKKCRTSFERPGVRGCFLSHYTLWKKCLEKNQNIGIFEDDVFFYKHPPIKKFTDILKLEKLQQGKKYAAGDWWEGAHAYIISPKGAEKLINWTLKNGILPADIMLGTDILDIEFDDSNCVTLNPQSQIDVLNNSLTRRNSF